MLEILQTVSELHGNCAKAKKITICKVGIQTLLRNVGEGELEERVELDESEDTDGGHVLTGLHR